MDFYFCFLKMLSLPEVRKILSEKVDVVVTMPIGNEIAYFLAHKLNATMIIWSQCYKTFLSVIYNFSQYAKVFVPGRPFKLSLILEVNAKSQSYNGALGRFLYLGRFLALLANLS
jgi:hypothetical protein